MKALYSTDAFTQLGTEALIRFSRELRRQWCGHCLPGCDETALLKHNVPDKTTTRSHTIVSRPFGLRDSCACGTPVGKRLVFPNFPKIDPLHRILYKKQKLTICCRFGMVLLELFILICSLILTNTVGVANLISTSKGTRQD